MFAFQAENATSRQAVEDKQVGVDVLAVVFQHVFDLSTDGVGEGYMARIASEQRLHLGRKETAVSDNKLSVLLLPFMAVGLYIFVFQVSFEVGGFVQEHPQEHPRAEVAVDADFVKNVVR